MTLRETEARRELEHQGRAMLCPSQANNRLVGFSPTLFELSASVLLCLALGACTAEKVTPVTWEFRFGCAADSERTDLVKLQVAKGACPLVEPVVFEAWTETPGSAGSRPQGVPSGEYAFHATALDSNGEEIASGCKSVTLPMQDVISLDLQATTSCDDPNVNPTEDAGPVDREPDGGELPDASRPDGGGLADASQSDASPCRTWWRDADNDGFGDLSQVMQSCTQPPGYVAKDDDCDDADMERHPDATELCDLIDSDCDASTTDGCPAQCTPIAFENRLYWFCDAQLPWSDAELACKTDGMTLVRLDSLAEHELVRASANQLLVGSSWWIGGTDSELEGVWKWTSGDVFWRGGNVLTGGGQAEGSAFTRWKDNEPGGGTAENCAQLREGGLWNDAICAAPNGFVCEQL